MEENQAAKRPQEKGFIWGYIWCVLVFLGAVLTFIMGVFLLVEKSMYPGANINLGIFSLLATCLYIFDGFGVAYRKSWGLILTYIILGISFLLTIGQFIALIVQLSMIPQQMIAIGRVTGYFIFLILKLIIDILWIGYFYRRRDMFT